MGSVLAGFIIGIQELGIRYNLQPFQCVFQPVTILTALYGQSFGHMIDCFDNFCTDKSLYHMINQALVNQSSTCQSSLITNGGLYILLEHRQLLRQVKTRTRRWELS